MKRNCVRGGYARGSCVFSGGGREPCQPCWMIASDGIQRLDTIVEVDMWTRQPTLPVHVKAGGKAGKRTLVGLPSNND